MKKTTLFLVLAASTALPALAQESGPTSTPVPSSKQYFTFLVDFSPARGEGFCGVFKCNDLTLIISRPDAEKAGKGTVLVDVDADEFCKEFVCDENTVRAKRTRR